MDIDSMLIISTGTLGLFGLMYLEVIKKVNVPVTAFILVFVVIVFGILFYDY